MNQFVAGFIGSPAMNLQTVPLADGRRPAGGDRAPAADAVRTAASQAGLTELVLGIRPEHLHLADGTGELAGEVLLVEELGADALLHVRLAESGNQVVARAEGRKPPGPGQQVTLPRPARRRLRLPPGDRSPACGLNRSRSTRGPWSAGSGRLPVPAYDRSLVTPGVVHLGVGGFHRAHLAMYHDRLLSEGRGLDWGICGVGVLAADRQMKQVLQAQDGLYTLVHQAQRRDL